MKKEENVVLGVNSIQIPLISEKRVKKGKTWFLGKVVHDRGSLITNNKVLP